MNSHKRMKTDTNGRPAIEFGQELTCTETGKTFIAQREGCTTNYARGRNGEVYSDEGVDLCEKRELLDRSKPFTCYLSSDGKHATGWKGNVLGAVVCATPVRLTRWSHTHGEHIHAINVRDVHGGMWHGRGSPGICITLRPMKGRP